MGSTMHANQTHYLSTVRKLGSGSRSTQDVEAALYSQHAKKELRDVGQCQVIPLVQKQHPDSRKTSKVYIPHP